MRADKIEMQAAYMRYVGWKDIAASAIVVLDQLSGLGGGWTGPDGGFTDSLHD